MEAVNRFETSGEAWNRLQWFRRGRAIGFVSGLAFGLALGAVVGVSVV